MKPHGLTYTALEDHNPQAAYESRVQGGYSKHHLDRVGRPPAWLDCDADEFLAALDAGRIVEPEAEPEPTTEGERLIVAIRKADLSMTEAAKRIGLHRQTMYCQLDGRRPLRRDVAQRLWELIEEASDV